MRVTFKRLPALGFVALLGITMIPAALASGSSLGSPTDEGIAGLAAAAAIAWGTGSVGGTLPDIGGMERRQCSSGPHLSRTIVNMYLNGMRSELAHTLGKPLRSIRINGVRTRNLTATTREA